ncbi:sulfopyruvate decarboxylase alpha subunit [Antricoccus suffuscus]|uniref:Sulfopyruvate decarboxylase alpha subunit n=1 Tax=Antricoccus suffuscus TaxID=1629062 RepID=A0A2T0ZYT1_9ACTN|nr:thiamine pyrophosphate-binding protein [Antricoccus suffuscus]PRZ41248.1 sulfopyruvate decarboxylase alpha subunit [Antricoccus suffuscus]
MSTIESPTWQRDVWGALRASGVQQVAYVPDAGHSHAIREAIADPEVIDVLLTSEQEGIGVVAGAWLGGQRAVLLMQSSGVGNCINMLSLLDSCRFPFLTLVTMRGEYAEFNPWQGPMGRATEDALKLMGVTVLRVDHADEVTDTVSAAADAAYLAGERVAVLIGQRLIGRKAWTEEGK